MSEASTVERNDVERNESRETEPDEEDDQVQAEELLKNVHDALDQLGQIWGEIGHTEQECDEERLAFFHSLQDVCKASVVAAEERKQQLIVDAQNYLEQIEEIAKELHIDTKELLPSDTAELGLQDHVSKLSEALLCAEKMKIDRLARFKVVQEKTANLLSELGLDPPDVCAAESNLSEELLQVLKHKYEQLLKQKRHHEAEVEQWVARVRALWADLACDASAAASESRLHALVSANDVKKIGLHRATIAELERLHDDLDSEKEARLQAIALYIDRLKPLWARLAVAEEERVAFLGAREGVGKQVLAEFEREVQRLEALKQSKMAELIELAAAEYHALCDEMHVPPAQRNPPKATALDEEALNVYESATERAQAWLALARPVLKAVARREAILAEKAEFERTSSDPSRLLGAAKAKGGKGEKAAAPKVKYDPTRLLREEKMRNTISKELPKLNEKLRKMLSEWEAAHAEPFLYEGVPYVTAIDEGRALHALAPEKENYAEVEDAGPEGTPYVTTKSVGMTELTRSPLGQSNVS